ncbi:MAG: glycosyltransferase family 4 protein [Gammaproteobacteria bacterium]|nr:glycosyltransferase family 4 protein [Gammaproteobacteria bacterium]
MAGQNFYIVGGSDRVLIDEIDLLNRQGHQAIPFCAASEKNIPNLWDSYFPAKIASFEKPSLVDVGRYIYNLSTKAAVKKLLNDFKPDIFHCHIYYGKLTSSILGEVRKSEIPLIQTLHEYKIVCPASLLVSQGKICEKCRGFNFYNVVLNKCNRASSSRSIISCIESYTSYALGSVALFDHFIAVSDFLRKKVIEMGVPEEKVTTVHNFTEAEQFKPYFKTGDYFIFFGRIEHIKGIWTLIKSFEELRSEKLVIVGTGLEYESVSKYLLEKKLDNISLMGFKRKEELGSLIQGAIATIAPSIWYETFGLTLIESFAYGKPVIASNIGGMTEVVEDGVDSILVKPGDVDDLVSAIYRMSQNKRMAVDMGRVGRSNLEKKFNKEMHYKKLMAVYNRFLR